MSEPTEIKLWGVKQNNLKNINVKIPLGSFTVICGPSGSGKSSLAFETLFAEGQRRFIESMSNYAKQFLNAAPKPDIEKVENIPPAIAIEQKNSVKNSRSTVGTTTEIADYLRLLFAKLGKTYCPNHNIPTSRESVTEATDKTLAEFKDNRGYILAEIDAENRIQTGKKLHSLFLQEGFLRIWDIEKKEVVDIASPAGIKKGLPKENFYLVIDRLSFTEEERGRIADSMTIAYESSVKFNKNQTTRKAKVLTVDNKILNLSEDDSCSLCGYIGPQISNSSFFSFNSPIGACQPCKGFGNILDLDIHKVIPNPNLSIAKGALHPFTMPSAASDRKDLLSYCKKAKIDVNLPWNELSEEDRNDLWNGNADFWGVKGLFAYLEDKKYKMHVRVFISRYRSPFVCPSCQGSRLRADIKHIFFKNYTLDKLSAMTVEDLNSVISKISLSVAEEQVAGEIFKQLKSRLNYLLRVGVPYLTMSRETRTLSGGEYQRLILANQLGQGLSQSLYVLDEPTVGLHPRDNDRLISILKDLKDLGNTLVVVEHDYDVICNAEHIIEMGPGSGFLGGEVVFAGSYQDFLKSDKVSVTLPYIKGYRDSSLVALNQSRPVKSLENLKYKLSLVGAKGHNLKNIDVDFPLSRLVVVTGVSGSGKSTLVTKTLYPALARALDVDFLEAQAFESLSGQENLSNVVLIDQSSIGKSARSNPMTYLKVYDVIRGIMSSTPEAKSRGYTPGTFSLNVDGGRCPACRGAGTEEIDMMFMDNVILPCDVCDGKKFQKEVLEIQFQGKNINQILGLTVEEAMSFFIQYPNLRKALVLLKEVGLEYICLGQAANSLSGGESQRLKIAKELSQVNQKQTLYILDEPTTGLHFREVELLLKVLRKLIDTGASIIVVEHNLDVIRSADHLIDLGPEAGQGGGQLVFQGSPTLISSCKESLTGKYLNLRT